MEFNLNDFKNLDTENIGEWPPTVKLCGIIIIFLLIGFLGWQYDLKNMEGKVEQAKRKEIELRNSFEFKQQKAANLPALKQQLKDIEETFGDLLKRLPSKSEIGELLVDISQQGLGAGLEFELFKPGDEQPRDFYAEVPIEIKVIGSYHQFGNFISGVSDLPRIVTNNKLVIYRDKKEGEMILETVAKTYRYLDEGETDEAK
ncbi:MAG: type 4a pilus biogenesis protein PilO [Pseudomonadota bacterium]|nr:type 4a pilus biogenesis protein PilO [Pseudomonadota bacterium]